MDAPPPRHFERYVALGDSSTEGLDDPDGLGGYRGWSRRLAERIAAAQGGLLYANLAVRGRTTVEIRDQQLAPALALQPDLATVFSGTNDLVGPKFDAHRLGREMEDMQRALIGQGATVITFTLPDLAPVMPIARLVSPRIRLLNESIRSVSARTGAVLVDFAVHPASSDSRLWSADRIHANSTGHTWVAEALAQALGLPGSDGVWKELLPAPPHRTPVERLAGELEWMGRHALPWTWRRIRAPFVPQPVRVCPQPELRPVPTDVAR
jgi:lysophospholipase L1-like esterase